MLSNEMNPKIWTVMDEMNPKNDDLFKDNEMMTLG